MSQQSLETASFHPHSRWQIFYSTFLEETSFVAIRRIYKSRGIALKIIWSAFMLLMISLYIYNLQGLIKQYMSEMETESNSIEPLDPNERFPDVTLCNLWPFNLSRTAAGWPPSLTPDDYRAKLDQFVRNATATHPHLLPHLKTFYSSNVYYQQISARESAGLGLKPSEYLKMCRVRYFNRKYSTGMFPDACPFELVNVVSTPSFYNCFTLRVKHNPSNPITSLTLMLKKWPAPSVRDPLVQKYKLQRAFRMNFLLQGENGGSGSGSKKKQSGSGDEAENEEDRMKVFIHEQNSLPAGVLNSDPAHTGTDEDGIYLTNRNGQFNDIRFQLWKTVQLESIKSRPCITNTANRQLIDNSHSYLYQANNCRLEKLAKYIIERCKCVDASLYRYRMPDAKTPYCHRLDSFAAFVIREKCLQSTWLDYISSSDDDYRGVSDNTGIISDVKRKQRKDRQREERCLAKCVQREYRTSMGKQLNLWRPNSQVNMDANIIQWQFESTRYSSLQPANQSTPSNASSQTTPNGWEDLFAVQIGRSTMEIRLKTIKVLMTRTDFLSKFGGLCSLYLGVSLAFIMECVQIYFDCFYNWKQEMRMSDEKKKKKMQKEADQANAGLGNGDKSSKEQDISLPREEIEMSPPQSLVRDEELGSNIKMPSMKPISESEVLKHPKETEKMLSNDC